MPQTYALVEHSSAINTIIHKTFQTTQRIKFTAFDVSPKYIIFGANSGGIYIFHREPCQFLKLIPSTHGPTDLLQISHNEENLAIAASTGLVIVLESCFNPNFEQQVFSEHEGKTVTALTWNGNDLYCGDSTGRVSVITLKNFLTKAMFQTPVACLMHLDSQIVQLDAHSKFLLVSTQTRSLLCDTETERYRQIGKKMRDGSFGACFLNSGPQEVASVTARSWGVFRTVGESEQLLPFVNDRVKIYVARPGVRLWQADFQANVVVTHQFRSSLSQKASEVIQGGAELKIRCGSGNIGEFNFGKIFPFLDKFVLSFRKEGFYVFEPSSSSLVFWSPHLSNIKDVKIVGSFLYIWHSDLVVSVLSLYSVEELILRSLFGKKFKLCGELCLKYFEEVQSLLGTSKKIHLISALEAKLENPEVLAKLAPLFQSLKESAKLPTLEKFKNGIVTVNALAVLPEPVQNFQSEKDTTIEILSEQYKISKIHKTIETSDFTQLMQSLDSQNLYKLLKKFQNEDCDCDSWCKEIFLKYVNVTDLCSHSLEYACDAFVQINASENLACNCGFPLPRAHQTAPRNYETGCQLIESNLRGFLKSVPYMHRVVLAALGADELRPKLPLMIQFSESQVIEIHSNKITYDLWDESVGLLLKLKTGQCLNCGANIDSNGALHWTNFGVLMVQSIKPTNAIKLFKRYSDQLPKGELDQFFYQYCVLSAVTNVNNNLKETLHNPDVKKQFEKSVGGFLRRKYLRGGDSYEPPSHKLMDNCDHCQMPLKIPVLEEMKLKCGHKYHKVCFLGNKSECFVCKPVYSLLQE